MFPYEPSLTKNISPTIHGNLVNIDIGSGWANLSSRLSVSEYEAKTLVTIGSMRRYVIAANAVLGAMHHGGFTQAYILLSSCIELLGRCVHSDQAVRQAPSSRSGDRLEAGLEYLKPSRLATGVIVETNKYKEVSGGYSIEDLRNLRNLTTHGGSVTVATQVKGDIELLHQLRKALFGILDGEADPHDGVGPQPGAIDNYCSELLAGNHPFCDQLADAAIMPDPAQLGSAGWPVGAQVFYEIKRHIQNNLGNNLPPISGSHRVLDDHFQLYP